MTPHAPLQLHFIVVGGCLSGLTTAYTLSRSGHRVTLIEKTDGKFRSAGAVAIPPNMTRLLDGLGLSAELQNERTLSEFQFWRGSEPIGNTVFDERLFQELRAKFFTMQHGRLHTWLFDLAKSTQRVAFMYNETIIAVDPYTPSVTFEDGRVLTADVVVGADGANSIVRAAILEDEDARGGIPQKQGLFMGTVPFDAFNRHPDLKSLHVPGAVQCWMSDQSCVYGHDTSDGYVVDMFAVVPDNLRVTESWDTQCDVEYLHDILARYEPRVQKLFKLMKTITSTQYIKREISETYTLGAAVLVGEAAHPMLPNGSNAAALATEDSVTLGAMFAAVRHRNQIGILLSSYEELREPRCTKAMQTDEFARMFASLPDGPEQEARDAGFLAQLAAHRDAIEGDDEYIRNSMAMYMETFSYDASEAVEDWKSQWGRYMDTLADMTGSSGAVRVRSGSEVFYTESVQRIVPGEIYAH